MVNKSKTKITSVVTSIDVEKALSVVAFKSKFKTKSSFVKHLILSNVEVKKELATSK